MTKKKEPGFEESLSRLQEISDKLERGDVGLDESIKLYEEGIKLAEFCYTALQNAELKVTELKKHLEKGMKE